MSEIANEIPTEASIDAPAAAPLAPVVDAPTECSADASAGSNAAAGDGPAIPRRAKHDRGRSANYTLKSLEESTTSLLGDDVALFAAFDQDDSPRLTRTQTRKRRSGAPVSPPKQPKAKRGRKSGGAKMAQQPAVNDEAGYRAEEDAGAAGEAVNVAANDAGEGKIEENAAVDMMERGELPLEDVYGAGEKMGELQLKATPVENQPAAAAGKGGEMQPEEPAEGAKEVEVDVEVEEPEAEDGEIVDFM